MTRLMLGLIVASAAATIALVVASAIVVAAWRAGERRLAHVAPRRRAQLLACWRLCPITLAVAAAAFWFFAFMRFEPIDAKESIGVLLPLLAAAGILASAAGLYRAARASYRTRRSLRAWRAESASVSRAVPLLEVDAPFPIVAVVGVWQPQLYVARQVLASCDRQELDAIIAHEIAHVRAHDNLTRLLFVAAPVVPFAARAMAAIESAWIAAAEEAADDAARGSERSATALASALTKVARLATGRAPLLHASAILSGSSIEHRVRRLLDPAPEPPPRRTGIALIAIALSALIIATTPALRSVYDVAEYCVRYLP